MEVSRAPTPSQLERRRAVVRRAAALCGTSALLAVAIALVLVGGPDRALAAGAVPMAAVPMAAVPMAAAPKTAAPWTPSRWTPAPWTPAPKTPALMTAAAEAGTTTTGVPTPVVPTIAPSAVPTSAAPSPVPTSAPPSRPAPTRAAPVFAPFVPGPARLDPRTGRTPAGAGQIRRIPVGGVDTGDGSTPSGAALDEGRLAVMVLSPARDVAGPPARRDA